MRPPNPNNSKDFYELVQRAEASNVTEVRRVSDELGAEKAEAASSRVHKLYSQMLEQAEEDDELKRAEVHGFFVLLGGRLHEICSASEQQAFTNLDGGFWHQLACEAMLSTGPSDESPNIVPISELKRRVATHHTAGDRDDHADHGLLPLLP